MTTWRALNARRAYVADMGHRQVVVLPSLASSNTARSRHEGFPRPFVESTDTSPIVRETSFDREPAKEAVLKLLDELTPAGGRPPFTAVICTIDQMAAGVLEGLRERGLRCPEGRRLGYGIRRHPIGSGSQPTPHDHAHPHEEMGSLAVELELDESEPHPLLTTELVIRDSGGSTR
ncbi:substrate-binding domain-containing protein [Microbacterium sp. M]|uniref:substrate-binding domain-containing protein n=1 Tax=Microbacterium sp. M TaxID=3377125 RepID=UPI003863697D